MSHPKLSSKIILVASTLFYGLSLGLLIGFAISPAHAEDAADALKKCDDLASHPLDGRRYSPPVSDDHFATGAAIDACETAVKLNPTSPRAQFELGRSYWTAGGERDKEAFTAFARAARNDYPISFKFIGDAFLEGRGLPPGESQSPQIALAWYQKAVAAGFSGAQRAIDEVQAQIDRQRLLKQKHDADAALEAQQSKDKAEREKFDPSIFQNRVFMSKIYNYDNTLVNKNEFVLYLSGFIEDIGGTKVLYINGQACLPQVAATTTAGLNQMIAQVGVDIGTQVFKNTMGGGYQAGVNITANMGKFTDQGERDAVLLFNHYGCDSAVTHAVISNINAYFDNVRRPVIPSNTKTAELDALPKPASTLRTPEWYNCSKASRGADYVICASPELLDAVARLEDAFKEAKAARGNEMLPAHKAWLESYSENCGLPARGSPDDSQITSARHCVLNSINKRISELHAER